MKIEAEITEWKSGTVKIIKGKMYGLCEGCGGIVRIDKPIFGSIHLCK